MSEVQVKEQNMYIINYIGDNPLSTENANTTVVMASDEQYAIKMLKRILRKRHNIELVNYEVLECHTKENNPRVYFV